MGGAGVDQLGRRDLVRRFFSSPKLFLEKFVGAGRENQYRASRRGRVRGSQRIRLRPSQRISDNACTSIHYEVASAKSAATACRIA